MGHSKKVSSQVKGLTNFKMETLIVEDLKMDILKD